MPSLRGPFPADDRRPEARQQLASLIEGLLREAASRTPKLSAAEVCRTTKTIAKSSKQRDLVSVSPASLSRYRAADGSDFPESAHLTTLLIALEAPRDVWHRAGYLRGIAASKEPVYELLNPALPRPDQIGATGLAGSPASTAVTGPTRTSSTAEHDQPGEKPHPEQAEQAQAETRDAGDDRPRQAGTTQTPGNRRRRSVAAAAAAAAAAAVAMAGGGIAVFAALPGSTSPPPSASTSASAQTYVPTSVVANLPAFVPTGPPDETAVGKAKRSRAEFFRAANQIALYDTDEDGDTVMLELRVDGRPQPRFHNPDGMYDDKRNLNPPRIIDLRPYGAWKTLEFRSCSTQTTTTVRRCSPWVEMASSP